MRLNRYSIGSIICGLVAMGAAVWLVGHREGPPSPPAPARLPEGVIEVADGPRAGNAGARVVLMEFTDLQCPYCRIFATHTLPSIRRTFIDSGQVLLIFRHLPIATHELAMAAAKVSECAWSRGTFWPLHDAVLTMPDRPTAQRLESTFAAIGLDPFETTACLKNPSIAARIDSDVSLAKVLGVTGTPTFFLGYQEVRGHIRIMARLTGAVSEDRLASELHKLLERPRVEQGQ